MCRHLLLWSCFNLHLVTFQTAADEEDKSGLSNSSSTTDPDLEKIGEKRIGEEGANNEIIIESNAPSNAGHLDCPADNDLTNPDTDKDIDFDNENDIEKPDLGQGEMKFCFSCAAFPCYCDLLRLEIKIRTWTRPEKEDKEGNRLVSSKINIRSKEESRADEDQEQDSEHRKEDRKEEREDQDQEDITSQEHQEGNRSVHNQYNRSKEAPEDEELTGEEDQDQEDSKETGEELGQ